MHGNIVNKEKNTRISFNCRFKSVFSPYGSKSIGETFVPINLKPSSILGMRYNEPKLKKLGFRGYIFSREISGNFIPQRVQKFGY